MAGAGSFLHADTDVLRGMALALRQVDKQAKAEWAKAMRSTGSRVWASTVDKRKTLPQDRVFGRAAVRWSQGGYGVATVTIRPLSGGLQVWQAIDFGSKAGTGRLPRYTPTGRVVYGAIPALGRYMGAMSAAALADTIRDTVGGD